MRLTIAALLVAGPAAGIAFAADGDVAALARQAVEAEWRRTAEPPAAVILRRVEVYRQSAADTVAVCGQASSRGPTGPFIDFAAVVSTEEAAGARVLELHAADSGANAARTRAESWLRCTDETRRLDARVGAAGAPQARAPAAPSHRPAESAGAPTLGPTVGSTVTMRQGGNLRAGPGAGSPVIGTLPRGTTLRTTGRVQDGWHQLGPDPAGWVHGSMLVAPPE